MTDPHAGDAGTAAAAPASPRPGRPDVVEDAARIELDRIRRRWSELPVDRAATASPPLRAVVVEVAARTAAGVEVPDLGPAVLADQLAVVVWDAYAAGLGDGLPETLAALRRALP